MFSRSQQKIILGGMIPALLTLAVQSAHADTLPTQITIAGSTAFKAFFQAPGSTNDFIDVNNDGIFGFNSGGSSSGNIPFVQQLAPSVFSINPAPNGAASSIVYTTGSNLNGASVVPVWQINYDGVGSVNGLQDMVNYQLGGALPPPTDVGNPSYINRTTIAPVTPSYNGAGAFPTGAMTSVDVAVLDVRTSWGVQGSAGTPVWNAKPTTPGYGLNPVSPTNSTVQTNKLASLSYTNPTTHVTTSLNLNTTGVTPDAHTVFDTTLAFAPISFAASHGTGVTQLTQTQIGFLYVTGRMADGSNLVAATRDIGSGTRNGAMNSVGVDPSFGVGENIGDISVPNSHQYQVGPHFQPTNIDATGDMESVLANSRLAVGYISTTNGVTDQASGKIETLGVKFDLEGGTQYIRPTASTLVNNDSADSYRVGGSETFSTVGDPLATTINGNYTALTANPQMVNTSAAAYIRNLTESLKSYAANPSSGNNTFMPVQSLVSSNFIPTGAPKFIQDPANPLNWIINPAFNTDVNSAVGSLAGLTTGSYGSGTAAFGLVPSREDLGANHYSDGQSTSYRFYDSTGTLQTVAGGATLNARNAIMGDFNNTGLRNLAQIPQMMTAVANPNAWAQTNNSGSAGNSLGNAAIPELLGDFNSDGNFDAADIRYYADGLAVDPTTSMVNRKAAFTAVDANWTTGTAGHPIGNYFNTTLKTGKPYTAGASRGDIAGSATGPTAGGAPLGADGTVNVTDVDYEITQIKKATGQTSVKATSTGGINADVNGAYSTLLTRATSNPLIDVRADFSADMNGDGLINKDDLTDLVQNVLGTAYGDINLDGRVDLLDLQTLANHWQQPATTWSLGDFDGNGVVDILDLQALANNWQFGVTGAGAGGGNSLDLSILPTFGATSSVPEPMSLTLLGLGAVTLLARRRK